MYYSQTGTLSFSRPLLIRTCFLGENVKSTALVIATTLFLSSTAYSNVPNCLDVCHSTAACTTDGQQVSTPECKCAAAAKKEQCSTSDVDCATNPNSKFSAPNNCSDTAY